MTAILSVDALVKRFGAVAAVDGCSLQVPRGSLTGLIGPNGAGKTTLFNIVAGALRPDGGTVTLDGRDVTGEPTHRLFDAGLVRTFQIPREFARMSVVENLMVVPPGQNGERLFAAWFGRARVRAEERRVYAQARETLDLLGLGLLHAAPAGSLSGGQKKLLELGRTMMVEAKLVLLDEPAAGVNRSLLAELTTHIQHLHRTRGTSFFIIEHDIELVERLCDPVFVLAQGRVLAQGGMAEIKRNATVQDAYLGETV